MKILSQQNGPVAISITQGSTQDHDLYHDLLNIRNNPYNYSDKFKMVFPFDKYSDHYRLSIGGKATGALSVTQAKNGRVDCEEYIPECLVDSYRDVISSACKFRIIKQRIQHLQNRSKMDLPKQVLKTAFKDQLTKGTRLDIINAHKSFARYYRQIGYVSIDDGGFIHPVLGTDSLIMYLPADPSRTSMGQDLFEKCDNPLMLSDVKKVLTRTQVFMPLTAA